ncbi:uncharacterized protein LOC143252357 isoform X2 [Tachypleus tridentatus]|uniref:uncharacterized protein LOC143252357 isoform X2 n=1 Tax=Tachypleus tridentatus TaxID=6853 RepID=UPI003FD0D3DA
MSRRTRNSSSGSTTTSTSGSVLQGGEKSSLPIVQQAQHYLEENVRAWMKPKYAQAPLSLLTLSDSRPDSYNSTVPLREINGSTASDSRMYGNTPTQLNDHRSVTINDTYLSRGLSSSNSHNYSFSGGFQSGAVGHGVFVKPLTEVTGGLDVTRNVSLSQSYSFPHSFSYSGLSQSSYLQETSYSSPCGPVVDVSQPSVAASFFARATQRLNLAVKKKRRHCGDCESDTSVFQTNFSIIIRTTPPPAPPALLRVANRRDGFGVGKVKVMLRVCPVSLNIDGCGSASLLSVDVKKKQAILYDPTSCGTTSPVDRRVGVAAPKMYAFDAVFPQDATQAEVTSTSLTDVIQAVVNGMDGCLLAFGHPKLGKTYTMIGECSSVQDLGATPCAISWLFKLISEQKENTGARFSVRASAVEITGKNEKIRDLLCDFAVGNDVSVSSPGLLLKDDPVYGTHLMNQSEIRAPTAEKAAFILDAALAARSQFAKEEDSRNSHFLFTLHVYQYRFEKGNRSGVAGGRSRLHLFDLGSCDKIARPRDANSGHSLSLSALGNVIIALFNGQKHVPYKESKLTQLLREVLGSLMCRAAMVAHVSPAPENYTETLSTIQLAARIHRLRRKKLRFPGTSSSESSSEDRGVCRPFLKIHAINEDNGKSGSSDPDYTSSSEQSCDTVIFVGERELTVNKRPNIPSSPRPHKKNIQRHSKPLERSNAQGILMSQETVTSSSSQNELHSENSKSAFNNGTRVPIPSSKSEHPICQFGETNPNVRGVERTQLNMSENKHLTGNTKAQNHQIEIRLNEKLQTANLSSSTEHTTLLQEPGGLPHQLTGPHSSKKSLLKHKHQHIKQDEVLVPDLTSHSNYTKMHTRDPKVQSDELWIDGPRVSKSKFDSRSLQGLHKEQWVDGPGVEIYGFMDEHKKHFVAKWIEDHSRHIQTNLMPQKEEVWIDFPPATKNAARTEVLQSEEPFSPNKQKSNSLNSSCNENENLECRYYRDTSQCVLTSNRKEGVEMDVPQTLHLPSVCSYNFNKMTFPCKDASPLVNNQCDLQRIQSMHKYETKRCNLIYDDYHSVEATNEASFEMKNTGNSHQPDTSSVTNHETDHSDAEMEAESVPMQDSCQQVTEEDIILSMLQDDSSISEKEQSETGRESCESNDRHPLSILSKEDLTLASSFTDSHSVGRNVDEQFSSTHEDRRRNSLLVENVTSLQKYLTNYHVNKTLVGDTALKRRSLAFWNDIFAPKDENVRERKRNGDEYLETISLPGKRCQFQHSYAKPKDPEVASIHSEPLNATDLQVQFEPRFLTIMCERTCKLKPTLAVLPTVNKTRGKGSVSLEENAEINEMESWKTQRPPRMFSHEVNKKIFASRENGEKPTYIKPSETLEPLIKQFKNLETANFKPLRDSSDGAQSQVYITSNEKGICSDIQSLILGVGAPQVTLHHNIPKLTKSREYIRLHNNIVKEKEYLDLENDMTNTSQFNSVNVWNTNSMKSPKRFSTSEKRIKSPFITSLARDNESSVALSDDNSSRKKISSNLRRGSASSLQNYSTDIPLISPYAKVTQARSAKSSSGRGSDSSVVSGEPREGSKLLPNGKLQQFSGTSSGYESMMRDSEETPVSSSQESGNEGETGQIQTRRGERRKHSGWLMTTEHRKAGALVYWKRLKL